VGPKSAHDVARELRRRLPAAGDVKIHKLLYYCQGWHLALTGTPLFHEAIEAWTNGPVVADLWHDERKGRPLPPEQDLDGLGLGTVGFVVSRYGGLNGVDLIRLTHSERPWLDVAERDSWGNDEITVDVLRRFFEDRHRELADVVGAALADPVYRSLLEVARERVLTSPGSRDDPGQLLARLAGGR
jgi:uncharacterized phage-associated protein